MKEESTSPETVPASLQWADRYFEYLELRKKGFRAQAFEMLSSFFPQFREQDSVSKRLFIDHIYQRGYFADDFTLYIPQNLQDELVAPEIEMWIFEQPQNTTALKWSLNLDHLKEAVHIAPDDPVAIDLFLTMVINMVSMNQHEVSSGYPYDGNPDKDVEWLQLGERIATGLEETEKKKSILKQLCELKECALKSADRR